MCEKARTYMYHSYHFVITDSYNSNTNRYVSGTFHLSEQDIWIEFYKHAVKLRDWKQHDIFTHISATCFLRTWCSTISSHFHYQKSTHSISCCSYLTFNITTLNVTTRIRILNSRFAPLEHRYTKQQLAIFPISLPGFVPPAIRGGRLERLKRTLPLK